MSKIMSMQRPQLQDKLKHRILPIWSECLVRTQKLRGLSGGFSASQFFPSAFRLLLKVFSLAA